MLTQTNFGSNQNDTEKDTNEMISNITTKPSQIKIENIIPTITPENAISNLSSVKMEFGNSGNNVGVNGDYVNHYFYNFGALSLMDDDDEKEEKILRPKKRMRNGSFKLPDPDEIKNDDMEKYKEILINSDSSSFDSFVQRLSKIKIYSNEEKELIKDIRRKIKNRESARKSRMNKKNKVDDLEKKLKKLTERTHKAKEIMSVLKKENNEIKSEIQFLLNLIKNNPIFANLFNEYITNNNKELQEKLNFQSYYLTILYSLGLISNNMETSPISIQKINEYISNIASCHNEFRKVDNIKSEEDSGSSIEVF